MLLQRTKDEGENAREVRKKEWWEEEQADKTTKMQQEL